MAFLISGFNVSYRRSVSLLDPTALLRFSAAVHAWSKQGWVRVPCRGSGSVEGRWVPAGAAAPAQGLEKLRLGAGEQRPERPVSAAGLAALDMLMECQLERAWLHRGCAKVGSVLSPTRRGSQGRWYFLALEVTAKYGAVAAR